MLIKNKKGFTLIELLVVIAIISILAGVVLVSMKSYGPRARASKALAQLSSAIPSMVSCWGNGNTVKVPPSSASAICRISGIGGADIANYGNWPTLSGDLASYTYGRYDLSIRSSWYFSLNGSADSKSICCNSTMNGCKGVSYPAADTNCTASVPAN